MKLTTASEVIRVSGDLEIKTALFYERLAQSYSQGKEVFLLFIKENRKNKTIVQRTYQEVVSDALETNFSFENLEVDSDIFDFNLPPEAKLSAVVEKALKMEEKIQGFYLTAAKTSKGLLADIPRIFERIAKKRGERQERLKSLF